MNREGRPGANTEAAKQPVADGTTASVTLTVPEIEPDADTLTAALAYVAAGWYVVPVKRGTKHPGSVVGDNWPTKSSSDPKQLAAWFAGTDHGIALHCGRSGAVVADVDYPSKVPEVLAAHLTSAPYQRTRPDHFGRGHYPFAMPPGRTLGNGTGRLRGDWGEIRGLNGVIIAAPSEHAEGGEYRWVRTGPVPVLPEPVAELLDDASAASDAATDEQVRAFLAEHTAASRPEILHGWINQLTNGCDTKSRHGTAISVTTGALKEARTGCFPAQLAVETLEPIFVGAATRQPRNADEHQRTERSARDEYRGIVAWSVAQANAADLDKVRARTEQKMPGNVTEVDNLAQRSGHSPPADNEDGDGHPWRAVDLEPVLSREWKPPTPSVGRRSDGVRLFYPRKLHTVASESEAGKTWLLLGATADELRAGNSVLYIDFEDDEGGVVGRLLTLQVAPEQIRRHFHYLRPTEALGGGENLDDLQAIITAHRPVMAVIDGITEAMTMHGLDPLSNKDIATFGRLLPRRLANAGPAVVCLDHVVKATDARGRYAIGGVHKLNGLDGAAFILENREPFGIGLTGRSTILIAKDRPGQLRKHGHRRKDGLHIFADLVLTSHDISYSELEILPDAPRDDDFRPTYLMAKISEALQQHGAMPQRQILATVKGKRQYAIDALALLQRDGYVSVKSPHELLRPFSEGCE